VDWDTALALAYAAEQLFVAAQALTSDLVRIDQGLEVADLRLAALLQNQEFLPEPIRDRVCKLRDSYRTYRPAKPLDQAMAGRLAQQTMDVLAEVRDVLANIERKRLAA
jgi:hypothetical protein